MERTNERSVLEEGARSKLDAQIKLAFARILPLKSLVVNFHAAVDDFFPRGKLQSANETLCKNSNLQLSLSVARSAALHPKKI